MAISKVSQPMQPEASVAKVSHSLHSKGFLFWCHASRQGVGPSGEPEHSAKEPTCQSPMKPGPGEATLRDFGLKRRQGGLQGLVHPNLWGRNGARQSNDRKAYFSRRTTATRRIKPMAVTTQATEKGKPVTTANRAMSAVAGTGAVVEATIMAKGARYRFFMAPRCWALCVVRVCVYVWCATLPPLDLAGFREELQGRVSQVSWCLSCE